MPRIGREPVVQADRGAGGTRRASPSTQSCGPVSAATTAFCVIEQTFDVEWLWSALHARDDRRRADRPAAAPAGHRVGLRRRAADHRPIAHVLGQHAAAGCAAPGRRSASRSRDRATTQMSAPRRLVGDRRQLALPTISAPVGLPGELMMMPRVRGVTPSRIASACSAKPSSGVRAHDHRRRVGELDLLDQRRPARHVRDDFVARRRTAPARRCRAPACRRR